MNTFRKTTIVAIAILSLILAGIGTALAAVQTDLPDYSPGSVVTVSGDNSDGAGYLAGETVHVDVSGPNGYAASCDATADDAGAWSCQVTLAGDDSAVGDYSYTATGQSSGVSQSGTFADAKPPTPTPEPPQTVLWTGNGTTNGVCNSFEDDPDLNPAAGQQGWLFILTSPFDGNGSTLDATFSDGAQTGIVGDFKPAGQGQGDG